MDSDLPRNDGRLSFQELLHMILNPRLVVWLSLLVVLQLADLGLTWLLIGSGLRTSVLEANPLAAAVLQHYGWGGMVMLKLSTTLVVLLALFGVLRRRPALGRRLLHFSCAFLLLVNCYSGWLALTPEPHEDDIRNARHKAGDLQEVLHLLLDFQDKKERLCQELYSGNVPPGTLVARMSAFLADLEQRLPRWRLTGFPSSSRPELVAAYLYYQTTAPSSGRPDLHIRRISLRQEILRAFPDSPCQLDDPVITQEDCPWKGVSGIRTSAS